MIQIADVKLLPPPEWQLRALIAFLHHARRRRKAALVKRMLYLPQHRQRCVGVDAIGPKLVCDDGKTNERCCLHNAVEHETLLRSLCLSRIAVTAIAVLESARARARLMTAVMWSGPIMEFGS
jgi:hypothetical protein